MAKARLRDSIVIFFFCRCKYPTTARRRPHGKTVQRARTPDSRAEKERCGGGKKLLVIMMIDVQRETLTIRSSKIATTQYWRRGNSVKRITLVCYCWSLVADPIPHWKSNKLDLLRDCHDHCCRIYSAPFLNCYQKSTSPRSRHTRDRLLGLVSKGRTRTQLSQGIL